MADKSKTSSKLLVKTPLSNLNPNVLEELGMFLNPRLISKDVRTLSGKLGYSLRRVQNFERERNPTACMLEDWSTCYEEGQEKTVSELLVKLEEMKRHDAVDFLKPYEFSEVQQESSLQPEENDLPIHEDSLVNTLLEAPRFTEIPVVTDKVALVIGNMKYSHEKLNQLMYPEHDARDVAAALHELEFKVFSLVNLTLSEMRITVHSFCRLLGKGVYAVLYYAGHGYEDHGKNYLIPVDADLSFKREDSFCAQEILQTMQECNTSLNLLIIDACRVRPPTKDQIPTFIKRGTNGNNIFAYSCCSQQVAFEEHDQRNGLYAQHLLKHIRRNVRIENILMDVAADVALTISYCTDNSIHQRPCHESDAYIDCRLTDPIIPGVLQDVDYHERMQLWQKAHTLPDPFVILENEDLHLKVQFIAKFSNVMEVLLTLCNKTSLPMKDCVVELIVDSPVCSDITMISGDEVKPGEQLKQVVQISALQKLNDYLAVDLQIFYDFNGELVSWTSSKVDLRTPLISSVFAEWDWWVTCGRAPPTKTQKPKAKK
ncbi:mucosa-associated lymphoid tissue lymphoma translocation protein 1-like [Actinia tenebrosa]|uniref:Mucosa-associated lymphoid tissue lymphoma translocation protein 1-like n=1 Tax=Actinia tenebrosa TaxID=6105 RepID=A0A6P8HL15_ACTTE|nr:mucosa-associated lymphoid tissue lymphoma translocation protein 1-like [Actinia tenebrosa]